MKGGVSTRVALTVGWDEQHCSHREQQRPRGAHTLLLVPNKPPRETTDPDGRLVRFDERTEAHLARRRPQMVRHVPAILDAIRRPDVREEDPAPGRERFYRRDLDPRRWLRVVVDFNETPAFVVTAFVQDHPPEDQA